MTGANDVLWQSKLLSTEQNPDTLMTVDAFCNFLLNFRVSAYREGKIFMHSDRGRKKN